MERCGNIGELSEGKPPIGQSRRKKAKKIKKVLQKRLTRDREMWYYRQALTERGGAGLSSGKKAD